MTVYVICVVRFNVHHTLCIKKPPSPVFVNPISTREEDYAKSPLRSYDLAMAVSKYRYPNDFYLKTINTTKK